MRLLFAASEIFPYAKSGGLADVADALPTALASHAEVARVMPLYGFMPKEGLQLHESFSLLAGGISYKIEILCKDSHAIKDYFIAFELLSATKKAYGDEQGDYANNDLRFGIFCAATVELATRLEVDILHLNDWQCALCALFAKEQKQSFKTLFTIHNLAYQGVFERSSLERLGIDADYFHMDALEFYGKVNFMKAGIAYADAITTVSPSYAKEILTPEFGCGLEGFLKLHASKLSGILNGINQELFDPSKDMLLPCRYGSANMQEKYKNKVELLKDSTLKDPRKPLFVMVSRLVAQKGVELLLESMEELLAQKLNLYIIGEGEAKYRKKFVELAKEYPNFDFFEGYDEPHSHRLYAAADFLLMPSIFEPCGLNQFIAMRYGAIPIVHSVGGLKDSVFEEQAKCGRGFVFEKQSKKEFLSAITRALLLRKDRAAFDALRTENMACDFSFASSAKEYIRLYREML